MSIDFVACLTDYCVQWLAGGQNLFRVRLNRACLIRFCNYHAMNRSMKANYKLTTKIIYIIVIVTVIIHVILVLLCSTVIYLNRIYCY